MLKNYTRNKKTKENRKNEKTSRSIQGVIVEIENKENEGGGRPKRSNQEIIPKNFPELKDTSCQIENAHQCPV